MQTYCHYIMVLYPRFLCYQLSLLPGFLAFLLFHFDCVSSILISATSFLFFFNKFIYFNFFLAALGLRCCVRAFSSCSERGLLFLAVRGLLTEVASLVVEHRF